MFGRIAGVYDLLNHTLSMGVDRFWRHKLARLVPEGGLILDLAAGTLDVSLALHRRQPEATILAMDFCPAMLRQGRKKLASQKLQGHILPCGGDAFALPLPPNSIDAVTIAFGIRNMTPRSKAFTEMLRVLRPGGKACILEFGSAREPVWGGLYNLYLSLLLPIVGRLVSRDKNAYAYLSRTIREFPSADVLAVEMARAGFTDTGFCKLTGGIVCLHWGEKPRRKDEEQTLVKARR